MLGSLLYVGLLFEVGELQGDFEQFQDLLDAVLMVQTIFNDSQREQSRLEPHDERALQYLRLESEH